MYLLSTFNKKVIGWGEILCFINVFVMPVYASNVAPFLNDQLQLIAKAGEQ